MRTLLTGKDGQLGWELQRTMAALGDICATGRMELDLADHGALRHLVRSVRPHVILNAAAYTAVDRAESDEMMATAINGVAPGILAEEARAVGALLIHYSTDYVFSGEKAQAYTETDPVAPLNAYGRSKLAGERAIVAAGGRHLILRTCWVYGARGGNFLLTMQRLLATRDQVQVVNDQIGSPTAAFAIAEATAQIAKIALSAGQSGIYNVACAGQTTWFGFAQAIADAMRLKAPEARLAALLPIDSASYPAKAKRPAYSVLSGERLNQDFGIALPQWQIALRHVLGAG